MAKFYQSVSEHTKRQGVYGKLKQQLFILIMTILYIPLLSICILAFTPIYIFRFIASQCSKILRPDLDKLVNTRSVVLAVDGFPSKPSWNILVWLQQEGILDLDKFRRTFMTDHVRKRNPTTGVLLYPEYQQYLHKWWGFYFWRWDQSFDIRNHIRPYDGKFSKEKYVDDEMLVQIAKELSWSSWHPKRSPWEFLQISNYRGKSRKGQQQQSIFLFRIHHVLGDGYYVLQLLMKDLADYDLEKMAQPKYLQRNLIQRVAIALIFWILAPYHLCKMFIEAYDVNPWHPPHDQQTRPMNVALTEKIPLDLIKGIKNEFGVCFSSVLNSALAGGMRRMMIKRGIQDPPDIHMGIPVPMPGRPQKLGNHFICSFINLPVGEDDPLTRLQKCEEIFQAWKRSSASVLNFLKVPLVGGLFPAIMGPITFNRLSTCLLSNFPGTPDFPTFQGLKCTDMMFAAGFGPGRNGIGFTMLSCKGNIRILSAFDPGILETDELVGELNQKIIEEFYILKSLRCKAE